MKKSFSTLFFGVSALFIGLFSSFSLTGCHNDLLDEPSINKITQSTSGSNAELTSPTGLTATQGRKKGVTLSWDSVGTAARYNIYSADSAFTEMKQVAETKDNATSYTVEEKPGVTKYYCVAAVDYSKKVSGLSSKVMGSTMATPVITNIESSKDGSSSTVSWWMDNCNDTTYIESIRYIVKCFSDSDGKNLVMEKTCEKSSGSIVFNNLTGATTYYYQVIAYHVADQTQEEKSDILDADTAHRLIPNAPGNIQASKGTSATQIELSWTLPDFTDVKVGNAGYEKHPVYFKVYRKEEGADDSKYQVIANYLGSVKTKDENAGIYHFSCDENSDKTTVSADTYIFENPAAETEVSPNYPDYVAGNTLTFVDKSSELVRGKKYTYKVQSYVDDIAQIQTADSSISVCDGWMIGNGRLSVSSTYEKNEDNSKFSLITFSIGLKFDPMNQKYDYKLESTFIDLNKENEETMLPSKTFKTFEELNGLIISFDPSDESSKGYYTYKVSVFSESSDNPITTFSELGLFVVTDDVNAIPDVGTVDILEGYSDKFGIKFTYNKDYKWTLHWQNVVNGTAQDEEKYTLTEEDLESAEDGQEFIFPHKAESGSIRKYRIEAFNGLSALSGISEEKQTLGTVSFESVTSNYDSIIITWNKVQQADNYTVKAIYESDEEKNEENKIGELSASTKEENGLVTCTIDKPEKYNNANYAGSNIKLSVTAQNNSTNSTTERTDIVRTLGPAATNAKVIATSATEIKVKWNEVKGASGYIVHRSMYGYDNDKEPGKIVRKFSDTYYVDKTGTSVKNLSDEEISATRAKCEYYSGSYSLTDIYAEADDNADSQAAYQNRQAQLSWGIPFGYVVFPVKNPKDFNFDIESSEVKVLPTEDTFPAFEEISDSIGATDGYGLNVTASKASINGNKIKITWNQPYNRKLTPRIYYRKSGSSENKWEIVKNQLFQSKTSSWNMDYSIVPPSEETIYEYAVLYNGDGLSTAFCDSYINNLVSTKEGEEQANKGYTMTFSSDAISVQTANKETAPFGETISWIPYDFSNRKQGPDYYMIEIQNLNNSASWIPVAKINLDTANNDFGNTATIENNISKEVALSPAESKMVATFSPIFNSDNCATGVLKVLRDARHNYRLKGVRIVESEEVVCYSEEKYTYREITPEELVKAVSLTVADALYKSGIPYKTVTGSDSRTYSSKDSKGNSYGSFYISGSPVSIWNYQNKISWGFNNSSYRTVYKYGISSASKSEFVSGFTLTSANCSADKVGIDENTLYCLPENSVTVSHECGLESYSKTIKLTAGEPGNSRIYYFKAIIDDKIVKEFNDENIFYNWFPYDIGNKHASSDDTLNKDFQTYQGYWWN